MPFIAVVYVKDKTTAARLTRNWGIDGYADQGYQMVGLYQVPLRDTVTCNGFCGAFGWGRHPSNGYLRHSCGRRVPWAIGLRGFALGLFDRFGINLLKRDKTPKAFQNPQGYGK